MGKRTRAWTNWRGRLRRHLSDVARDWSEHQSEQSDGTQRMAITLCRRTGQVGVNALHEGETLEEFARRFDEERLCPCGGCGRPVSDAGQPSGQNSAGALSELMAAMRRREHDIESEDGALRDFLDEMHRDESLAEHRPVRYRWGQRTRGGEKPN